MSARPWIHEGIPFHRWLSWRAAWLTIHLTLGMAFWIKVHGRERVPEKGGAMLLSNHTTFFDFLICFYGVYRPVHAIGTEQVFRVPVAGFLLRQLNGIPFSKGKKDRAAVGALADAYKKGAIIGMFPEGFRSWTGETQPVRPGTGRLVKSLGCPVIFCRVSTGFMQHPRWARWPRRVPWVMEYDAPVSFPEDATVDEINAMLEEGIRMDPNDVSIPRGAWGFWLADGLPRFLWGCPGCGTIDKMSVPRSDRNTIVCGACSRRWRVDLKCIMHSETDQAETMSVADAQRRMLEVCPDDAALSCPASVVSEVRRGQFKHEPLATGRATLASDGVEVTDGDRVVWSLPYSEMTAVLLQVGNKLHVRTQGANYQLDTPGQSALMWHHYLGRRATSAASQ